MTSLSRGKRSKVSGVGANPIQPPSRDISGKPRPCYEEVRLRAYEIYLEPGGIPGNELDDWPQADCDGPTPQAGESTDIEGHRV